MEKTARKKFLNLYNYEFISEYLYQSQNKIFIIRLLIVDKMFNHSNYKF